MNVVTSPSAQNAPAPEKSKRCRLPWLVGKLWLDHLLHGCCAISCALTPRRAWNKRVIALTGLRCPASGAWLLGGGGPDAHPVDLGFLGAWPFRYENPRSGVLDFLGFPWILSSESRLINGLRGF
jgi:hypothetical protein